ncbi:MAG: PAS domain-containing protein, partial [Thiohalorhabdaceae bacterium]
MSQGQAFFEWRHSTWDGEAFPAEVLLSRIDQEEGPLLQAVVRDITDRKQAEAALREREQELAEAQRIARVGSWVSDFRTNEIRWSDEVYRIFGLSPEEWGATQESFMAAVHPDDRKKVQAAIEASLQGEPYDVTHRVARPNDEVRILRERGYTEFETDGEPVRMIGTVQDITQLRQ